jgi:hypothetical protein
MILVVVTNIFFKTSKTARSQTATRAASFSNSATAVSFRVPCKAMLAFDEDGFLAESNRPETFDFSYQYRLKRQ